MTDTVPPLFFTSEEGTRIAYRATPGRAPGVMFLGGFKSDIPDLQKKLAGFPEPDPLLTDFTQAVRTRQKFALNEANAHRSCTICNLGKIAVRLNRPLHYDPDAERFIDDEEANRLIDQPMRGPWLV